MTNSKSGLRGRLSAWAGLWVSAAAVVPGATAIAAPFTLVVETRADAPGGQELFVENFPTLNDFVQTGVHTNLGFSLLNIDPAFKLVALTNNGSAYAAVVETRVDAPGGQELFVETFPTLNDFVQTGVHTNLGFSLLNIDPAFELAGFTFDGSKYVAVVETRADAPGGQELFVETFPTLNDFVQTGVHANPGFSLLNIDPAFRLAALTYDGSEYLAVVETRTDAPGGQELFVEGFPTLNDFVQTGAHKNYGFSLLDIDPAFELAGFTTEIAPTVAAPEPTTAAILLFPLLSLLRLHRLRRHRLARCRPPT
jgi:hypothetical protein